MLIRGVDPLSHELVNLARAGLFCSWLRYESTVTKAGVTHRRANPMIMQIGEGKCTGKV